MIFTLNRLTKDTNFQLKNSYSIF